MRTFGNDGRFSYKVKCISIGFVLYILGLVINILSGTWQAFVSDIGFLIMSLLVGVIVFGVFAVLKEIEPTLKKMDVVIGHSDDPKFKAFLEKWNGEPIWFVKERYSYHGETIFLTVLLVAWFCVGIIGDYGWVRSAPLNRWFYAFWIAVVGYLAGVVVNRYGNYTFLVNEYCRDFLDPNRCDFILPKTRSAFKALGRLALKADLVLALPTIVILWHSVTWSQEGIFAFSKPWHMFMTVVYMLTLVFVFFFPIMNAHRCMAKAKEISVERINASLVSRMKEAYGKPEVYTLLDSLLSFNDRFARLSTWPLDVGSTIGASFIFILPVLTGAAIQLFLEYVIKGFRM